ncbi:hypothetical protein KW842_07525 [Duganella sp. sic0402]|uniref:hypothetical protein n=1 Tax=Duganella sp. sic0402 TaxID=2854786 RepID=UPI001C43E0FC|nr:hypothetical protein [Duganella sp. sic0402]MBV7535610.1 hypothetical protein [Duganella sp. sic0402]
MDNDRQTALEMRFDTILPTLATKSDIEAFRSEMHKMAAEGYRWMVASMVGMFLGFGGLYFAASRQEARPIAVPVQAAQAQPAQTPPAIIINIPPQK